MKKIAIVYDWMDKWGGVERILLMLHELFPQAVYYTSFVNYDKAPWARELDVRTSFMQRLPSIVLKSRLLSLPFFPYAFESFNLREYDIVLSITSSFAKGVITDHHTKHISLLLTPPRFLWQGEENYQKGGLMGGMYKRRLREWDVIASERPDEYLAISKTVARRCRKYYHRDCAVLYPPFDIQYWQRIARNVHRDNVPSLLSGLANRKYCLVVSRLERYKRVDIAVDAFKNGGLAKYVDALVIVGRGTEEQKLKARARMSENIIFYNSVNDTELAWLYQHAQAHIMPQEEDFGYTSLEAQYFNCPVIAFNRGGAVETVIEGKTGLFFDEQTPAALVKTLERFAVMKYNLRTVNSDVFQENVARYDKDRFAKALYEITNL